ncbi:hypothetical protein E3O25_04595 [Cryobacterium sp. TMT1-3]|uniref:TIGR03086 family protein n=2 Tax=Microbacteriaceae TaxID=85023 RepID=A0A5F0D382_9MICO|nr:hypothetical protein E3O10_09635 [Cryobacterium luteum]TFC29517.1 hypothetical protein E3O25_04595 [Cryobacterium sp. TMT1-3]
MKQREMFLQADAALRSVIDQITPAQLDRPAPAEWSRKHKPTLRDILASHAEDEAWLPAVLEGKTIEEVGDTYRNDLLGDDPIGNYDRINEATTAVVNGDLDPDKIVHLSYGDYPLKEALQHTALYRAFQAWSIARHIGLDYSLPDALVENLWEQIAPDIEMWRGFGVFPPEVPVPEGANREVQLLGKAGYWRE